MRWSLPAPCLTPQQLMLAASIHNITFAGCAACRKHSLHLVPLQEAAYWASWSLTHWLTLAASGLLCALVGAYPFRHSSLALMTAFYWLFSAALISFSYFLSTLFTASRVAGTATQFVYALSMIPG